MENIITDNANINIEIVSKDDNKRNTILFFLFGLVMAGGITYTYLFPSKPEIPITIEEPTPKPTMEPIEETEPPIKEPPIRVPSGPSLALPGLFLGIPFLGFIGYNMYRVYNRAANMNLFADDFDVPEDLDLLDDMEFRQEIDENQNEIRRQMENQDNRIDENIKIEENIVRDRRDIIKNAEDINELAKEEIRLKRLKKFGGKKPEVKKKPAQKLFTKPPSDDMTKPPKISIQKQPQKILGLPLFTGGKEIPLFMGNAIKLMQREEEVNEFERYNPLTEKEDIEENVQISNEEAQISHALEEQIEINRLKKQKLIEETEEKISDYMKQKQEKEEYKKEVLEKIEQNKRNLEERLKEGPIKYIKPPPIVSEETINKIQENINRPERPIHLTIQIESENMIRLLENKPLVTPIRTQGGITTLQTMQINEETISQIETLPNSGKILLNIRLKLLADEMRQQQNIRVQGFNIPTQPPIIQGGEIQDFNDYERIRNEERQKIRDMWAKKQEEIRKQLQDKIGKILKKQTQQNIQQEEERIERVNMPKISLNKASETFSKIKMNKATEKRNEKIKSDIEQKKKEEEEEKRRRGEIKIEESFEGGNELKIEDPFESGRELIYENIQNQEPLENIFDIIENIESEQPQIVSEEITDIFRILPPNESPIAVDYMEMMDYLLEFTGDNELFIQILGQLKNKLNENEISDVSANIYNFFDEEAGRILTEYTDFISIVIDMIMSGNPVDLKKIQKKLGEIIIGPINEFGERIKVNFYYKLRSFFGMKSGKNSPLYEFLNIMMGFMNDFKKKLMAQFVTDINNLKISTRALTKKENVIKLMNYVNQLAVENPNISQKLKMLLLNPKDLNELIDNIITYNKLILKLLRGKKLTELEQFDFDFMSEDIDIVIEILASHDFYTLKYLLIQYR